MAWLRGVDVSKWQGEIDWAVLAARVDFAFVKATGGVGYVDPQWRRNWRESRGRVVRGAYHFFRSGSDPGAQARFFVNTLREVDDPGELPPVLDLERGPTTWAAVTRFMDEVERMVGRRPIIYTSPGFALSLGAPPRPDPWPLWVAHYDAAQPSLPAGWTTWAFWQHTVAEVEPEAWGVQSRRLDMNVFRGDWAALVRFVLGYGGGGEPQPQAERWRVTTWRLNVRRGPGVRFGRVGVLRLGDVVEVLEQAYTDQYSPWGRIGAGRWVSLQYAEPAGG